MEKMMDALVKTEAGKGLTLMKMPIPTPGPGEVLIKVHKTAICGTDVHIYNWDPWAQEHIKAPMTIGHEYVGEVAALGAGVTGLKIGQRVSGEGHLTCHHCGKQHELTPLGELKALDGETKISHIPDYYRWEREQVREEILSGKYRLECDVDIAMQVDYKAMYRVGKGRLVHDLDGFHLTGCDGKLDYTQGPLHNYGLYADYLWYEIGDVICIGNRETTYCCFPKGGDCVAKTRMAVEELYKLKKRRKPRTPETV